MGILESRIEEFLCCCRCFVRDLSFQLSGIGCGISLVSDEDDDEDKCMFLDPFLSGDHDRS